MLVTRVAHATWPMLRPAFLPVPFLLVGALAGNGASLAASPPTPVPAVAASPDPLAGVVRTVLPDGLVLLSKEVHAAPVVSVRVFYKVGSRDEVQGIFGISHQVEHMMFKGTELLKPGDIDRMFSERGGENNAETTQDYTDYQEDLPSSALDVALRVEADRMEHSAMLASELAHEKNVVLSEIEGDLNSPLYNLDTAVNAAAFQANPYKNPVGGYLYDIHHFTRGEVAHYYATHYAPNNAVLVVVGDFDTSQLRRQATALFRSDPSRAIGAHPITPEPPQRGERRVNVVGVGDTAYVEIGYHVPQTGARDHYVMDVISTILGGGRSSRLYRALVERGLASEVDAGDPDMKDPYLMVITATVAQGHTQAEVEAAVESELDRLKTEPVSAEELQKTLNQVRASFVYRDDSAASQAADLGMYAAILSERYLQTYLPQIQSVTAAEIQAAAQRYFGAENRTVGWFLPRPPRPGEVVPSGARGGAVHYRSRGDIEHRFFRSNDPGVQAAQQTVGDPRPRRTAPVIRLARRHRRRRTTPAAEAPAFALPAVITPPPIRRHPPVTRQVLPNGMVVIVYPNHANADISVAGRIRAGAMADPNGKAGLAAFTAALVNRGTTSRTEDQIASQLDYVGAAAAVDAGESGTFFTGHSLDANLPLVLDILSDELQHPNFPPAVFARVKNEILTGIQQGNSDPGAVASHNFFQALYPADYPLHWPVEGTLDTVPGITLDDIRAFHDRFYRPDLASIVIVGDIEPPAAIALVQKYFGEWQAPGGPAPATEPPPITEQIPPARIVHTMPDKTEELTVMGFRGIARNDPDYYPAFLMNLILGNGDFNSRFMKDIRDHKGLVYYVGSQWDAGRVAGPWMLQMESAPGDAPRAIQSAVLDMQAMQRTGATSQEMRLFKSWVGGNQALALETSSALANLLSQAEYLGLGMDYIWRYPALIDAVTPAQVQQAAQHLLQPDHLVTSMAGPAP